MSQDSYRVNLTQGSVPRLLLKFAWPMLLQNVIQSCYALADSIWLGKLVGPDALASVSVSNPVTMVVISFILAIFMASTLLIAQYAGANDQKGVRDSISTGLTFALYGGIILTIAGVLLSEKILDIIQTPPAIKAQAATYLRIIFLGSVFMFGYNAIGGILRGLGDSRTAMWFALIAAGINIVLDPIFIAPWGLNLGIAGAAWATILSQVVAFVLALYYMVRVKHLVEIKPAMLRVNKAILGKMFKIGLPMSVQQTLLSVMFLFVAWLINGFGENAIASNGILGRIDSFAFMPSFALYSAISTVAGQNLGALNFERARETLKWGTIFNVIIATIVAILVFVFAPALTSVFLDASNPNAKEVIDLAIVCARIGSGSYILFSVMHANNGFINGSGGTLFTMILVVCTQYIVRMPLAYYLSRFTSLGLRGVYIAMYATPIIAIVCSSIYIASGRWKRRMIDKKQDSDENDENREKATVEPEPTPN